MEPTLRIPRPEPHIRFRGAVKRYGAAPVLDGLDLEVPPGQKLVLLGPSGAGKSTLLRCVVGLDRLDAGELVVDGVALHPGAPRPDLPRLRSEVGLVFQAFHLFPHLTALDNVALAPQRARGFSRDEARARAAELLSRVGLGAKADAFPRQLSGGQQQRVAIARVLAMRPKVVLFDEPTSALDPERVAEVVELITEVSTGRLARTEGGAPLTVVVATHAMAFARRVADRVVFLDGGRVVEDAVPAAFFGAPSTARVRTFLGHMTP